MCGFAGFVAQGGDSLSNSLILKMTGLINHRGPDDEGFFFMDPNKKIIAGGGDNTPLEVWETLTEYRPTINIKDIQNQFSLLAFGHKRLSILDLTPAGHQPMSYSDGRYWIVYNGEIYNYADIKIDLEKSGHIFKTKTDTETILAAYSEWGEDCLNKFVGMWAFVIYDKERNEVFLARDRFGIKPLYYYFSIEGDFYFASEIKQFTVLKNWQSAMNNQRVYDQLVYSFTDHTDETMFAGVYQLPGGTYFKSSIDSIRCDASGRIHLRKWYLLESRPYKGSYFEAASIFRALFERAVKEHLNADVPVGTALSGGLDSSSIVCEVNRILTADGSESLQRTFSSCSTDERFSEKKWMDIVINYTKIDSSFVYPQLKDVFDLTKDIIWHQDEPYQSQSAFLAYNVFKMANEKGVKVLLNGQGADEYLGGYGQFTIARYAHMARQLKFSSIYTDIKNPQNTYRASTSALILSIIAHLLPSPFKRAITNIKSSSDNVKRLIDVNKLSLKPVHPFDSIPVNYGTVPEISKHLTFYSTLPKYLHWEDRNSMAHSVEARVPFLDHRLVEFAYNLPADYLEKDGITKRIMREAMRGLLPEKIRNRKDKMGYTTPEEKWVKNENPAYFRAKISEAISLTNGIIKPDSLKYFDKVVNGSLPFDYTYWRLIIFSEWIKAFQVKI